MRFAPVILLICSTLVSAASAETQDHNPPRPVTDQPAPQNVGASSIKTGRSGQQSHEKDTPSGGGAKSGATESSITTQAQNSPALANSPSAPAPAPAAGATAITPTSTPPQYYGHFNTEVLAGGATNVLVVPIAESRLESATIKKFEWKEEQSKPRWKKQLCSEAQKNASIIYRKPNPDNANETFLGIALPSPACWFLFSEPADLQVFGNLGKEVGDKKLFDEEVYLSSQYLPLLITLLALALIYPGCAAIYWFMRDRNFKRGKGPAPPSFLASLDPVQLTANPWGRGSISKLQIFMFTLIVFGLLIFYLFRNGVLAGMSSDVMLLLGISAAGAVGGKIAYRANRRLSLESWAWLIRHGWLPKEGDRDVAPRAQWSDLFLDSTTREFDPYAFQMAIFSVVVAVALARSSFSGLGTFKIPGELLALLGISQAVFVSGKAIDKSGYPELDDKIAEVQKLENELAGIKEKKDAKPEEEPSKRDQLVEVTAQAAQIFIEIYQTQLPPPGVPPVVKDAANKKMSVYAPANSLAHQ
jgi:hypothetical protein